MITQLSAGVSALTAFSKKMRVTANNVANVNSDGFKKSRTTLEEGPSGDGVRARVNVVNTPGYMKQVEKDGVLQEVETSNVDLAEEIPGLIATQAGYKANLATIRTLDEMIGSLLDTIG